MAKILHTEVDGETVTFTWDDEPTNRERSLAVYRYMRATAPERTSHLGIDIRLAAPIWPETAHVVQTA
jgi:hypothetical protein